MTDPTPATGQRLSKEAEDALLDTFFPPIPFDDKEAMRARDEPVMKLASELCDKDASLPYISAFIMAGDILTGERSRKMVAAGVSYQRAVHFVGSYARLDFALWAQEHGFCTREELLDDLPDLWRGSDPDDMDPRFLTLWHEAWVRNRRKPIIDGRAVPGRVLTIYRGQDAEDDTFGRDPDRLPVGIAWSLDEKVAQKFANGAALRVSHRPNPVVYVAKVERKNIYAYLTGRGESEVVVNPFRIWSKDG